MLPGLGIFPWERACLLGCLFVCASCLVVLARPQFGGLIFVLPDGFLACEQVITGRCGLVCEHFARGVLRQHTLGRGKLGTGTAKRCVSGVSVEEAWSRDVGDDGRTAKWYICACHSESFC